MEAVAVGSLASASDSLLLVIDLQEKLLPKVLDAAGVVAKSVQLIRACRALEVPVVLTEQYPKGLGPTVPEVLEAAEGSPVYAKTAFSCLGDQAILDAVRASGARTVLLAGVEAHVCVLHTALDLRDLGLSAHVVTDAVGARSERDRAVALERVAQAGAVLATVEMTIFELVRDAAAPAFKAILPLVK